MIMIIDSPSHGGCIPVEGSISISISTAECTARTTPVSTAEYEWIFKIILNYSQYLQSLYLSTLIVIKLDGFQGHFRGSLN